MPNVEPTNQGHQKRQIEDSIPAPKVAKISKVYHHTKEGDNNNIQVDVETHTGETYQNVWWMTPSGGMVSLPHEGHMTILAFLSGETEKPVAVGNIHSHDKRSPLNKEGDFRVRLDDAVIESRDIEGKRTINMGFQPEDGGNLVNGLILREGETPKIIDENGNNLLVQQSPGGGGSPGGQASGFESIPTGGAGGDGTGIGKPGFNISNTVDAVQDLGMDKNGNSPINSAIEGLSSNTEVVFPKGTYQVKTNDGSGATIGGNDIWLHGKKGQKRGDVKFQLPAGRAGTGFAIGGSNIAITNATFDHSNHKASVFGIQVNNNSGNSYFYNIQHIGKNLPSKSLGDPLGTKAREEVNGKVHCWGFGHTGNSICHIENYKWTDPETTVKGYPNGLIGMQAPVSMSGTIELVNNHMAWRSEHNVYASRCKGGVHVKGGYYHNSCNTNLRIEGSKSYVEDATIHVDMDPSRTPKSARGLRWENNQSTASSGGRVTNCDFVYNTQVSAGNACLIKTDGQTSGLTIENSRFYNDNNNYPSIHITVPGVTIKNCHFTGSSNKAAVRGNGDTEVNNSCLSMSNSPGFKNCNVSGTSSGNCDLPAKSK